MSTNILEEHLFINPDRTIYVPDELKTIGVQFDHDVETVTFDCPRYWDGIDLSTMKIYINYMRPDGVTGSYIACNIVTSEETPSLFSFDWTVSRNVTQVKGTLQFLVTMKSVNSNGKETHRWSSLLNKDLKIAEGLKCEETIITKYPDIVTQLLMRMDSIEEMTTPEAMQNYVNTYLNANPLELDSTLTSSTKAPPADKVGDISNKIDKLRDILFTESKIVDCQSESRYFEKKLQANKLVAITNEIKKHSIIKTIKFMGSFGDEDLDSQINYIYYISKSGKVLYRKKITDVYDPVEINYEAEDNGKLYYQIFGSGYDDLISYPIMVGYDTSNHPNDTVVGGWISASNHTGAISVGSNVTLSGGGSSTCFFSIIIDGTVPKI